MAQKILHENTETGYMEVYSQIDGELLFAGEILDKDMRDRVCIALLKAEKHGKWHGINDVIDAAKAL